MSLLRELVDALKVELQESEFEDRFAKRERPSGRTERLRALLSRAESAMTRCQVVEWVPVSDPPKKGGLYRVAVSGNKIIKGRYNTHLGEFCFPGTTDDISDATHWLREEIQHPAQLSKEAAGERAS